MVLVGQEIVAVRDNQKREFPVKYAPYCPILLNLLSQAIKEGEGLPGWWWEGACEDQKGGCGGKVVFIQQTGQGGREEVKLSVEKIWGSAECLLDGVKY